LSNAQSYDDAQQLTAQLKTALVSRDLIGQAKGILIARGAADEEAAFAMLVTASQRTNVKVRDVAQRLVTEAGFGHGLSRNPPRPPA
jgi:AmiR/NasT family two-component response regulator